MWDFQFNTTTKFLTGKVPLQQGKKNKPEYRTTTSNSIKRETPTIMNTILYLKYGINWDVCSYYGVSLLVMMLQYLAWWFQGRQPVPIGDQWAMKTTQQCDNYLTLHHTGPARTSTLPTFVYHWANEPNFTTMLKYVLKIIFKKNCVEKNGKGRSPESLVHFAFTL